MPADAYLPVLVENVGLPLVFRPDGQLRETVRHYCRLGVVRVIAGPLDAHLIIDIRRPYYRPRQVIEGEVCDAA